MDILMETMIDIVRRMREEIENKKLEVKPLTDKLQEEANQAFIEGNDELVSELLLEQQQVYKDYGIADLEKYCLMQENIIKHYLRRR